MAFSGEQLFTDLRSQFSKIKDFRNLATFATLTF